MRRRVALQAVCAGAALPALGGCADIVKAIIASCPQDVAETGGIDWIPDILHPVFYGMQEFTRGESGAPADLRIWYPTYDGSVNGAPMLKMCVVRWPLVLFLHGDPPMGCSEATHYRNWTWLPRVLAKAGYVVVVPHWGATITQGPQDPVILEALAVIDWARGGWQHGQWIDSTPEATAVAGHSYGAILAAHVAAARPSISAYVGWSGGWNGIDVQGDPGVILQAIDAPSYFMWVGSDFNERLLSDPPAVSDRWGQVALPKYRAAFAGGHFDYLAPQARADCRFDPQAPCTLIERVSAELSALFIARYVPGILVRTEVPASLDVVKPPLTFLQEWFWGSHLRGLEEIRDAAGCSIDLAWETGSGSGSRHIGP